MGLPPELIEKLRRTGIRLDAQGRFWHEGEEITHRGFHLALLRWLDRLPDGRPILRLDSERFAYVDLEDAALLVVSARRVGESIIIKLNDESEEQLLYNSLEIGAGDALYCLVKGGRLDARITTPAYYVIAESVTEEANGFTIRIGGQVHPIGRRTKT